MKELSLMNCAHTVGGGWASDLDWACAAVGATSLVTVVTPINFAAGFCGGWTVGRLMFN